MDKTNRNIANTSTNTANAQQQANRPASRANQPPGATTPSASAALAQQAPSLGSAAGSNPRTVQDASNRKLDLSCNILNALFAKIDTDDSAIGKIVEMLKKDENNKTLIQRFEDSHHTEGLKFIKSCGSNELDLYCNKLNQLFGKIDTDDSAIGKIVEMLKKDENNKTLIQRFEDSHHTEGLKFIKSCGSNELDLYCNKLNQLFGKIDTDDSAIGKIVEMLNRKDENNKTLIQRFIKGLHVGGLEFLNSFVPYFDSTASSFLEKSLEQNLEDLNTRRTILDILNFTIDKASAFTNSYQGGEKNLIEIIENILLKLLSPSASLDSLQPSIGVFQLAQVINQQSVEQIQDYIFEYSNSLEAGAWNETSPEQFALYFVYGFLGKNSDVLGSLVSRLEACADTEFKGQVEQKISEFFGCFLNDLREAYIKDYGIQPNDYDDVILYVCKALPQFVDEKIEGLLMYAASYPSINLLKRLIAIENPNKQCFLDLIYSNMQSTEGSVNGLMLSLMKPIEDVLVDGKHFASVSPVLLNLDLPHLIQYLSEVSMETIADYNRDAKQKQFQYLILSILTKDISCIERFKDAPITSPKQAQLLSIGLIQLMKHLFGMPFSNQSVRKPLQNVMLEHTFGMNILKDSLSEEVLLGDRELFFKILDTLKVNLVKQLDVTTNLLNLCLKQDFEADMAGSATPNFDYMLQGLKKRGFDLHYIDPETGLNILAEAYELEMQIGTLRLFAKLLDLGCNPFLIQKIGTSVYHQIDSNLIYGRAYVKGILRRLKLDTHPFLPPSFTKNILSNNRLEQRDEQGRTPLMLYVMMNIDITSYFGKNLQKLEAKHLEAKDKKGWTVFKYARHNNDQKTLDLLNACKEALEKKADKPSLFRQAAQAAGLAVKLATPKAPSVEASKTPAATSSSSKRRQARKLRAKEGVSSANETPAQEITINYNPATGTSTTSMAEVRREAAEARKKEEAKLAAKQKKKEAKNNAVQNTEKKEGLFAKAKKKIKAVATTLETAKNLATHPQTFVQKLASKLGQSKAGERLASGQKVYNLGKAKPVAMLGYSSLTGPFTDLAELADRFNAKAAAPIEAKHIKVLEELDTIRRNNNASKVKVKDSFIIRLQDTLRAIMGMGGKRIKGSHQNIAWEKNANEEGGGITMAPHGNKMDIQNLKSIYDTIEYKLKCLLRESEATLSSMDSSGADEWQLSSSSETSSHEEVKDETSESSESDKSE